MWRDLCRMKNGKQLAVWQFVTAYAPQGTRDPAVSLARSEHIVPEGLAARFPFYFTTSSRVFRMVHGGPKLSLSAMLASLN